MSCLYLDIPLTDKGNYERCINLSKNQNLITLENEQKLPFNNFQISDTNTKINKEPIYSSNCSKCFSFFYQPSNTKYSNTIYVNETELNGEKYHLEQQRNYIIHPCSSFRLVWIILLVAFLILNLSILPIAISFFSEDLNTNLIIFNSFFDFVFILDIIVNFRTGIINEEYVTKVILNPKKIARIYFKTWFPLDILSSLPLDYIYFQFGQYQTALSIIHAGRALRILRNFKLWSLFKLLRIFRLVRYVLICEKMLNVTNKAVSMINTVLFILILTHWFTCMQFFVSMFMNFPEKCWVVRNNLQNKYWTVQYWWSFFKTIYNMLSLGYGQYPPKNIAEACITLIVTVSGAILGALFMVQLIFLLLPDVIWKVIYKEKLIQIERYTTQERIMPPLKKKLIEFYSYCNRTNNFENNKLMKELPASLQREVKVFICQDIMKASQFFNNINFDFLSNVASVLKLELFLPGDIIITERTIGSKMYFIKRGTISISTNDGRINTKLHTGSSFGDLCLLSKTLRTANVKAETYVIIYSLDRNTFLIFLKDYPNVQKTFKEAAEKILLQVFNNHLWQIEAEAIKQETTFEDNEIALGNDSVEKDLRKMELSFQKLIIDVRKRCASEIGTKYVPDKTNVII